MEMKVGDRYGKLVCIGKDPDKDKRYYLYQCDCGNVKSIIAYNVYRGATISCGCYQKSNYPNVHHKHGLAHTRIDNIYKTMIARCHHPACKSYKNYGAKGITVCDEWKNDRVSFYNWSFTHGYRDDLTIDRIDPLKGYSPENCRWADYITQNNHRKSNRFVEIDGERKSIADWSRISGLKQGTILYRINQGWNPKEAVFKPVPERR